jgi:hypothetical protein
MVRGTEYIGIRRFRRPAFAIALIHRCRARNSAKSATNSFWPDLALGLAPGLGCCATRRAPAPCAASPRRPRWHSGPFRGGERVSDAQWRACRHICHLAASSSGSAARKNRRAIAAARRARYRSAAATSANEGARSRRQAPASLAPIPDRLVLLRNRGRIEPPQCIRRSLHGKTQYPIEPCCIRSCVTARDHLAQQRELNFVPRNSA